MPKKPKRKADVRSDVPGLPAREDDLSAEMPTWSVLHGPQVQQWDPSPLVKAFGFQIRLKAIEEFVVNAGPIILVFVGLILVATGLVTTQNVVTIIGLAFGAGGGAVLATRRR